jgi:hypothetical protein
MTTTDEFIRGTRPRGFVLDEHDEHDEPDDCDCIVGPDEEAWLRLHLQHRNSLRLVAVGTLGFALALAVGLSAAWQIDRWAADWHYGLQDGLPMPPKSFEPSAYVAPGEAA